MQLHAISTSNLRKALGLISLLSLLQTQVYANDVKTITNDMQPLNDAAPHGVPSHWPIMNGSSIEAGNDPPPGWTAITAKGQVYRDVSDSRDVNTRIELKNINTYVLSRSTGKWTLLQYSVAVGGGSCTETYSGPCIAPDFKYLDKGSVAIKLAHGRNLLFWPNTSRGSINPNDIVGIFTTVQARLIVDDPAKRNDISAAKYLINLGGDYWRSLSAQSSGYGVNNTQIGMSRLKYVTATWQDFNFTTLSAVEIANNPPPGVASTSTSASSATPAPARSVTPAPARSVTSTPAPSATPTSVSPSNVETAKAIISDKGGNIQAILNDMGASEGRAHGIEDWPQSKAAKVENNLPAGWTAGGGWGQVYRDSSNSGDTNTRVALRDFRVYLLDNSGRWNLVSNSGIGGGHWSENYSSNNAPPAAFRTEPDGSRSDKLVHNYNLHFFPNRFRVDRNNYRGILVKVSARLIVDNPSRPDDRRIAKYLFNVGGDWWKTPTIGWCGWSQNPASTCNYEIGFSKFKYVTNDWRTVNFTNVSADLLNRYPPPL